MPHDDNKPAETPRRSSIGSPPRRRSPIGPVTPPEPVGSEGKGTVLHTQKVTDTSSAETARGSGSTGQPAKERGK